MTINKHHKESRINPQILKAIWDNARKKNPEITRRSIYRRIALFQKNRKIPSKRKAANFYALEQQIDVSRILNHDEITELEKMNKEKILYNITEIQKSEKVERKSPITIRKEVINVLGLPQNLTKDSERMMEAYQTMYVFENLVRYTIKTTLEKKYGKKWWNQPSVVSKKIRDAVNDRQNKENENRWHSRRGDHGIFYTNFGHLDKIISNNQDDFKGVFGDLDIIKGDMKKLELLRNIFAHNNPISIADVKKIKMLLKDLLKQLNLIP